MKTSSDTDVKDSAKKLQQLVKKMEIVINQVVIAQWLARRLTTREVLGSNTDRQGREFI